jgi:hypothetical protein
VEAIRSLKQLKKERRGAIVNVIGCSSIVMEAMGMSTDLLLRDHSLGGLLFLGITAYAGNSYYKNFSNLQDLNFRIKELRRQK